MNKKRETICRTKGCENPVLEGKYCEHCKQKRKELRDAALSVCGVVIGGAVVRFSKPLLKGAGKVAKVFLVK